MKKSILLVWIFQICLFGTSQITTASVAEVKESEEVQPYDSTKNFIGVYENPSVYKGQVLYLPGKHETLRKYGYDDFIIDMNESIYSKDNEFRGGNYESLADTYFDVLEVHSPRYGTYFLELRDRDNGERCYFNYSNRYAHSFPFIVVAYYEYLTDHYIGKKMVTRGGNWMNNEVPLSDMITGEEIESVEGKIWTIVDLSVEEKYYKLAFILEDDNGNRVPFTSIDRLPYSRFVLYYDDLKEYEGTEYWDLIIKGKIKIGFTEEMTLLSWGNPTKVNRSSSGDQWVYDGQYVYFEGGMVTAWN